MLANFETLTFSLRLRPNTSMPVCRKTPFLTTHNDEPEISVVDYLLLARPLNLSFDEIT